MAETDSERTKKKKQQSSSSLLYVQSEKVPHPWLGTDHCFASFTALIRHGIQTRI
jgi:hypothetical protein